MDAHAPSSVNTDTTTQARPMLLPLPANTPERLPIECAGRRAELLVRTQQVHNGKEYMSAAKFEKLCGRGKTSKWKQSFSVAGRPDVKLQNWLSVRGLEQKQLEQLAQNVREVKGIPLTDAQGRGRRRSKQGSLGGPHQHETEDQELAPGSSHSKQGSRKGRPAAGGDEVVRREADGPQPEAACTPQHQEQAAADGPRPKAGCTPQHQEQAAADGPPPQPEAACTPQHQEQAAGEGNGPASDDGWRGGGGGGGGAGEAQALPLALEGGAAQGEQGQGSCFVADDMGSMGAAQQTGECEVSGLDEDIAVYVANRERLQQEEQQWQQQQQQQRQQEELQPAVQDEAPPQAAENDSVWTELVQEAAIDEGLQKKLLYFSPKELKDNHLISEKPKRMGSFMATIPVQVIIDGHEFPPRVMKACYGVKTGLFSCSMRDIMSHLSDDIGKLKVHWGGQGRSIAPLMQTLMSPGMVSKGSRNGFPRWSEEKKCYLVEKNRQPQPETAKRGREEQDAHATGMADSSQRPSKAPTLTEHHGTQGNALDPGTALQNAHEVRVREKLKKYQAKCDEALATLESREAEEKQAKARLADAQQQLAVSQRQPEDIKSAASGLEEMVRAARGPDVSSCSLFRKMVDAHTELISFLISDAEGHVPPQLRAKVEEEELRVQESEAAAVAARAHYEQVLELL